MSSFGLDVSTPAGLARGYADFAGDLLKDARQLLKEGIYSSRTGHYIITLQAIELGLKAYLITKGFDKSTLRAKPYGHDLVNLLKAAKEKGLVLTTPHAEALIEWVNEWHCHDVKIRYEFKDDRELPTCDELIPLVVEIIQKTSLPLPGLLVDRVSPLNADKSVFEVHSVPLGKDAFEYARDVIHYHRRNGLPERDFLVELAQCPAVTMTTDEVLSR